MNGIPRSLSETGMKCWCRAGLSDNGQNFVPATLKVYACVCRHRGYLLNKTVKGGLEHVRRIKKTGM